VRWLVLAFAAREHGERVERGDQRLASRYPCYRVYECADRRYYSVAALEPKFWKTLCEAVGRPDLIAWQYSEDPETHRSVQEVFRARSRAEWEKALQGLEVCCEPVLDLDEVVSHPQVVARGLLVREGRAPRLGEHTEEVLREIGL
jgi:crotonobetainyl-CoA:carnitine CoA-transferase CaiB-like acyl-CoA transferase